MTTVSKNVYDYVLDEIVDKWNNTYHGTIEMKQINIVLTDILIIALMIMTKNLNIKSVTTFEYQCIITFLLRALLHIGWKKYVLLNGLKILYHGHKLFRL